MSRSAARRGLSAAPCARSLFPILETELSKCAGAFLPAPYNLGSLYEAGGGMHRQLAQASVQATPRGKQHGAQTG
jgi:hypothetical protein